MCLFQTDRRESLQTLRSRVHFDSHRLQCRDAQDWLGGVRAEDNGRPDNLAHELQLGEIHVVMSHAVNGGPLGSSGIADERFMERLQRVYDLTCSALGFRQSYALNRHVLEL